MKSGLTKHATDLLTGIEAVAESRGVPQPKVGHALLALLQDTRGSVAAAALTGGGITLRDMDRLAGAPGTSETAVVDMTELASVAVQEAQLLVHSYAGPEHVLLALLAPPMREATEKCLRAAGTSTARVRKELFGILGCDDPLGARPDES
jgi:ATP-dependent Clp protease ATP-binding subunit ClpA